MKVIPLTCALGAEIQGVNLAEAGRNADMAGEVKALLLKHKVLFSRDQDMTDAEHAAFARIFGELESHPLASSTDTEPGIINIWKSPESPPERYENAWHHDATWRELPPMGAVLRCLECPPVGGDTMWANMELAYDRLPDHIKETIAGLKARHSMEATFMAAKSPEDRLAMKARFPDPEHPVVRTHPVSGKRGLLVVEEGQPDFIEQNIHSILHKAGLSTQIHGKDVLPMGGEYTGGVVDNSSAAVAAVHLCQTNVS